MQEYWKIVGLDGVELLQLNIEESRILVRVGPASGFMTQSNEPPEAPVKIPSKETADALALLLRGTSYDFFKNAKAIRA